MSQKLKHVPQSSYNKEELLSCCNGKTFGPNNAKLPLPPMLMFDRITQITKDGGKYGKGSITAELDISPENWYFSCHFVGDPVMPGCLGLDAMWQLIGFYLGWSGFPGRGRALGAGEVKFFGQVTPDVSSITYKINIKRVMNRKIALGIGDGEVLINDKIIYSATNLRVGLFQETDDILS